MILSIEDLRNIARRRVPRAIFDYADGGSYAERTLRANAADLDAISFRPRVMVDVGEVNLGTATNPIWHFQDDAVTVGQMIQFLGRRLTMEDRPIALHKLLSHSKSERALVPMFLALLELVRLQAVLLRQDRAFSEIFVKKSTEFDSVMNEGMATRDDWR